jgi:hypothetical protein
MQRGAKSSEAKGRNNWERMRKRNYCTWGESLFKADSPAHTPRSRRKSCPTRTKATQPMTREPESTIHTTGVLVTECGEGEPPREEQTTARSSAPLHLHRKQRPSLRHRAPGPQVILLGRRFLGAERANHCSRQCSTSSGPPQKTEKVIF